MLALLLAGRCGRTQPAQQNGIAQRGVSASCAAVLLLHPSGASDSSLAKDSDSDHLPVPG